MSLVLGLLALLAVQQQIGSCSDFTITYYSAEMYPGVVRDGSTTTVSALNRGEPIAAAHVSLLGSWVWVEGLDVYRIADTGGGVGYGHIDILVWSTAEAIQRGRETRRVCVIG